MADDFSFNIEKSVGLVAEGKGEYLKYEDVFDTKKEEK